MTFLSIQSDYLKRKIVHQIKANRTLTLILNTQTSKQGLDSQVENKREKKIQIDGDGINI